MAKDLSTENIYLGKQSRVAVYIQKYSVYSGKPGYKGYGIYSLFLN